MKDEMNILQEVSSICAAHGSIALSEIIGKKVNLYLPTLEIASSEKILNKLSSSKMVICVFTKLLSGINGDILLFLDEKSAFKLNDVCYSGYDLTQRERKKGILTEMGISLIKEVGSVIISAYVGALSIIIKTLIIPSIPTLLNGPAQQIMGMAISTYKSKENLLLIEANFEESQQKIRGCFYIVLTNKAIKFILKSCEKILKNIEKS